MSTDALPGSRAATAAARLPGVARGAVVAAALLAVLVVAATAVAVALPLLTGGDWLVELFRTPEPVVAPSFALVGALLVPLPRARRLGWLLLAVAVSAGAYVLAVSWARAYGDVGAVAWARTWVWLPALLLTATVLPQVLPHGVPLPGRWRVPAAAGLAFTVLATATVAATGVEPFSTPLFVVPLLAPAARLGRVARRPGPRGGRRAAPAAGLGRLRRGRSPSSRPSSRRGGSSASPCWPSRPGCSSRPPGTGCTTSTGWSTGRWSARSCWP